MSKRIWIALIVVGISLWFAPGFFAHADDPKPPTPEKGDIVAKVLVVEAKAGIGMRHVVLENVQVKRLGDASFLVGKIVKTNDTESRGTTLWLPVAEVSKLVEFDDVAKVGNTVQMWKKDLELRIKQLQTPQNVIFPAPAHSRTPGYFPYTN